VVSSIASGEAVLSETERELGVAVADIGAGTTDIALYADGTPFYTSVVPLGGVNVTNDIAIGLRTNLTAAEQLKMQFGSAASKTADPATQVAVEIIDDGVARPARKSDVTEIIDARMRELFEKIGEEITEQASAHRLPAGLVLTGGGSHLADIAELARDMLEMPVRVASPEGVGGLTDHLLTPSYSTAIGLLLWAARVVTTEDLQRYEPPPRTQNWDRMRETVRRFFP
jgi:cell division protein FtsA